MHVSNYILRFVSVRISIQMQLRESLPKTGPLRFGSENQFLLNFAHEYILVQKQLKPH